MILEHARDLPGAHLVARPRTGVAHVYRGPLTRSGRYVPSTRRPECRARTRRLSVLAWGEDWTSLAPVPPTGMPRLCARCSASLGRSLPIPGEAGQHTHRSQHAAAHADLAQADVALGLLMAEDLEELAAAAWLSLLLFGGHAGCKDPVTLPDGRTTRSLHELVRAARGRLGGFPDAEATAQRLNDLSAAAALSRREAAAQRREERRAWDRTTHGPTHH